MKKVLGLDLGTSSIGWALVNEAENEHETSSIIKLGVRVNPLTTDEKTDFEKGNPLTTNASRTLNRGARRNLQRYKLRRTNLIDLLLKHQFISKDTPLTEVGKNTTHQTLSLRAKAAQERIELEDLAKVLLGINKKRGYKSSRKTQSDDEGVAIDGMSVAKHLYDNQLTPGQYTFELLQKGKKHIPDFYRSDLKNEFEQIWDKQKNYYPNILTDGLKEELIGKTKKATWAIAQPHFEVKGIKRAGKTKDQKIENYQWRVQGLQEQLDLEEFIIVLQEINNQINKSSGYLGNISDRSKELYFNNLTVGQYLYKQLLESPHTSLKNQVFYRQDYLDEFETIWEQQSQYHKELTQELKEHIRDVVIFYQRKLKSQKSLLSYCQFESWGQTYKDQETGKEKKRTVGRKVIPKSSPLFQQAKIWQSINALEFTNEDSSQNFKVKELDQEIRNHLFQELNLRGKLSKNELLKILGKHLKIGKLSEWKSNYEEVEGNNTFSKIFNVLQTISTNEGYGHDWNKKSASEILEELKATLPSIGINADILEFNPTTEKWTKQTSYQLWHLLYATEEDDKVSKEDKLTYGQNAVAIKKKLHQDFGFPVEYAKLMSNITFPLDYGSLSAKALRKLMPYLEDGHIYSEACAHAGYNHSNSFTKEELEQRVLKDHLDLLPKNSLRNPVVEKILNQMVNVINQIIDTYGKPDEIRIELARELKKSAKERKQITSDIAAATKRNEDYKKYISKTYGIPNPTKSDIVRYRLYLELEKNGFKDVFRGKYIAPDILFSKQIDIEHIIPKALSYDDSFSNKTLAFREDNLKKSDRTAIDFITTDYATELPNYLARIEELYKSGAINKAKYLKLKKTKSELGDGFIERDLRNSQYIAKKAKQMLFQVCKTVTSTTGSVTDRLRFDWGLINMMKELNIDKYRALNLTEFEERLDLGTGKLNKYEVITDWSKRNDHRHHAMDALTVAFTTHKHMQYINHYNARRNEKSEYHATIKSIENLITKKDENGKRVFVKPLPRFRESAKEHIQSILVSYKNKNKVTTWNTNISKKGNGKLHKKRQATPRGQLHKETVYAKSKRPMDKMIKLNARFTHEQAKQIINSPIKKKVIAHLAAHHNDPKKAFSSKELKTTPILYKGEPIKEVQCFEEIFTIRKDINPDNFKNEKIINKIVDLGIRNVMKNRLAAYKGDPKKAFSDLDKNPIWINESKGIAIKRVTITGVNNAIALHHAKDHLGNERLDEHGNVIPTNYVSTGNNHHVAIYEDQEGNLQEKVVSFFEAVTRVNQGLSPIDKTYNEHLGWTFKFTMKQNEFFVFPNEDFDLNTIDLLDPQNAKIISPHLFRVQKIATKYYVYRHHLETTVSIDLDFTYRRITSLKNLIGLTKVRLNHIGNIVQIGEY